jgi:hypothetical protein
VYQMIMKHVCMVFAHKVLLLLHLQLFVFFCLLTEFMYIGVFQFQFLFKFIPFGFLSEGVRCLHYCM